METTPEQQSARVFFALWPSASEREQLAAWLAPLQRLHGGRAMRSETLHNTLVFIGAVALDRLEPLQLAAQEVRASAFELRLDEARYWGHNHIVYATPSHVPRQIMRLVGGLEHCLLEHHFKFDQRAYQPHVTLLRNAHRTDAALPEIAPVRWHISDFALMQSQFQDGLVNYRVLARFPLK